MNSIITEKNGVKIAVVSENEPIVTDAQSALDIMASLFYESDCNRLAISKQSICPEFFILSSGIAGEILQKVSNYRFKLAIYGDFSKYTSKPLKDFMYECNSGRDVFFVETEAEAVERLSAGGQ